ncbi:MAG: tetratricopeptide repeat protein [Candidatus Omnitrophota bacterium]
MVKGRTLFILAAIVFVLYVNILPNPFVWDDHIFILQNEFIRDWKNIPSLFQREFFTKSYREASFVEGGYYRPLVMVLYTLEYALWKDVPYGYHAVSILLHLANVFLVYLLLLKLFQNEKMAWAGSLLFASHPVHAEAVSYLPSRSDLLAAFFCLLAFFAYASSQKKRRTLSLFWFSLALLSKENAVVFPALLLAFTLSCETPKGKPVLLQALLWTVAAGYLVLRIWIFPIPWSPEGAESPAFLFRILSFGKLSLAYLGLLLFPYPLHLERLAPYQTSLMDIGTVLWLLVAGGLVWLFRFLWTKNRTLFFWTAWFWIAWVPVSNVIPLQPSMAEHYLYFPSIGFFAVVAFYLVHFLNEGKRLSRAFLAVMIAVVGMNGVLVIGRNRDFSNELRLFLQTEKYAPASALIHNNLGAFYYSQGKLDEAKIEFEKAVFLNPDMTKSWANLGTVYREKKEYAEAIRYLEKAVAQEADNALIWNKLGIAYAEAGSDKAEEVFRKAISLDSRLGNAYYNLGVFYWRKGLFGKASFPLYG